MIAKYIHSFGLMVIVLFMFVVMGCGGGGERSVGSTNTTGGNDTPNTPAPAPAPAPAPGGGNTPSPGTGTTSLSWTPPTTYEDGSTLVLAGHYIYMDSGNGYVKIGTLTNPSISDYLVQNLATGTYSFVVTAFDAQGIESTFSSSASITI